MVDAVLVDCALFALLPLLSFLFPLELALTIIATRMTAPTISQPLALVERRLHQFFFFGALPWARASRLLPVPLPLFRRRMYPGVSHVRLLASSSTREMRDSRSTPELVPNRSVSTAAAGV